MSSTADVVLFSYKSPCHKKSTYSQVESHLTIAWAVLGHLLLSAWPYTGLLLLIFARTSAVVFALVILLLSSLLLPPCQLNPAVIQLLDVMVFQHWRMYSQYKVTYNADVEMGRTYIYAEYPHGVFPLGGQLHAVVRAAIHKPIKVLIANVLFCVPLWRHYMSVCGCVSASKSSFRKCLDEGYSVSIQVGGIGEMYVGEKDREVILLARRRGFVRIAVEKGVPIVPVYHFGNSKILDMSPKWLAKLSRKLRMSLGFVHGRFGLPLPRRVPVWTVVGSPLDVGSGMDPDNPDFPKKVEEVHQRYVQAIKDLYYSHRGAYSDGQQTWKDRPLVIL